MSFGGMDENAENRRSITTSSPIDSITHRPGDFDLTGVLDDDWSSFISGLESFGNTGCNALKIPDPAAGSFGAAGSSQPTEGDINLVDEREAPNLEDGAIPSSGSAHLNLLAPHHPLPPALLTVKASCDEEVFKDSCQKTFDANSILHKSGHPEQVGHVCKRPSRETRKKGSDGAVRKPASKTPKALNKEERLQKRLEKNRKTAARSRERKKQEMKEKSEEVQSLKIENARLKNELEVQKRHAQLLREELASFTRGAKEGTADAATTEPAELISTTTLPSVHDTTVMTMQHRAALNSSSSRLVDIWSALALSTSQTGGLLAQSAWRCPSSLKPPAQRLHKTRQRYLRTKIPC